MSLLTLALRLSTACDSLAVLPSATADGLGGMYAKVITLPFIPLPSQRGNL